MESWLSGLRRTTGNRVWAYTPPRVQIPNSPHEENAVVEKTAAFFCAVDRAYGMQASGGSHWQLEEACKPYAKGFRGHLGELLQA